MRNLFFKGFAAITMGLTMTACMQEFDYEEQVEKKILNNAEQTLGFHIPEGQDWVMSSEVTANISVNITSGENYTIDILSNNPLMNDVAYVLASGEVANGGSFTSKFRLSSDLKEVYLTITDSKGETIYRKTDIDNGQINFSINSAANSRTRSVNVHGDTYSTFNFPSDEELEKVFPTEIPAGSDEAADLETLYKGKNAPNGQTMWDMYAIFVNQITKGYNLKVTKPGEVVLGGSYMNLKDGEYQYYNVYVNVDGDVTIKRWGDTMFNLYIIKGNVTLDSDFGQMTGIISVGENATLNDPRTNGGSGKNGHTIKYFNRGTYTFTNTNGFDLENDATFYNEKETISVGPLTYSAGSSNTCYFINYGDDAELTAPSMTLNSTCHFFTDGKVNIDGDTKVTKEGIVWINNGHYTTGTMTFSAGNATFYNYCQLIVEGNAHFYDGEFNLMKNSYIEAGTSEFDNFIINMKDSSAVYVKGNSNFVAQADGTYQGFYSEDDCKGAAVKLGGTTTIDCHKYTLSIGPGITYAINNMKIMREGSVVTLAQLDEEQSGDRPVTQFRGVESDFNNLAMSFNNQGCGGSTDVKPGDKTPNVWTYAFEDRPETGDYDMNDVVLKVCLDPNNSNQLIVKLVAAGCEYNNEVYFGETPVMFTAPDGTQTNEVHAAFGVTRGTLVNTGGRKAVTVPIATAYVDITGIENFDFQTADFNIVPVLQQSGKAAPIHIVTSGAPYAIVVPTNWKYPEEHNNIVDTYMDEPGHSFGEWASDPTHSIATDWYNHPTGKVIDK